MKSFNRMKQVLFNFDDDQPKLFNDNSEKSNTNLNKTEELKTNFEFNDSVEIEKLNDTVKTIQNVFEDQIQDFDNAVANNQLSIINNINSEKVINYKDELMLSHQNDPVIKVIGIGGAGNNIVDYISSVNSEFAISEKVTFYELNTDSQHLNYLRFSKNRILIESPITKGMGSGGNPDCGRKATEDFAEQIKQLLIGTDICIIVAGMGKGTGTGGAPVVAKIAKDLDILTLAFVTLPTHGEGQSTMDKALNGLRELNEVVDAVTSINNDNAFSNLQESNTLFDMYLNSNIQIGKAIKSITDMILIPCYQNIDLADVKNFFIRENFIKSFLATQVKFKKEDISKVNNLLINETKKSLFDQTLKNVTSALILFYVNDKTPNNLIENTIDSVRELSCNSNLSIIYGIRQNLNLEEEIGFDLIALQDGATTINTPKILTKRINNFNLMKNKNLDFNYEQTTGKRSKYLIEQNKQNEFIDITNNQTNLVSYSLMEDEFDELMETQNIDTDKMTKIVNNSIETFYKTKQQEKSLSFSNFRDSKLFEN